jgi:hypothetical protein
MRFSKRLRRSEFKPLPVHLRMRRLIFRLIATAAICASLLFVPGAVMALDRKDSTQ